MEQAIRDSIAYRQAEQAFIARGLKSRDQARQSGRYSEASAVLDRLQGVLDEVKFAEPSG
ncbi:hypothetical protein Thiowin_02186 [Thiorhodovibrio winogradskyi]|uniref:Prevent-host-death protein n=1 Tax=Thiorhodovibrio winogradskyi TaxID=77007 RepID=A0ABZ0S9H6_9GAMM|nr:hypothetical protein [Thiorhodovibrio winogradskyi]